MVKKANRLVKSGKQKKVIQKIKNALWKDCTCKLNIKLKQLKIDAKAEVKFFSSIFPKITPKSKVYVDSLADDLITLIKVLSPVYSVKNISSILSNAKKNSQDLLDGLIKRSESLKSLIKPLGDFSAAQISTLLHCSTYRACDVIDTISANKKRLCEIFEQELFHSHSLVSTIRNCGIHTPEGLKSFLQTYSRVAKQKGKINFSYISKWGICLQYDLLDTASVENFRKLFEQDLNNNMQTKIEEEAHHKNRNSIIKLKIRSNFFNSLYTKEQIYKNLEKKNQHLSNETLSPTKPSQDSACDDSSFFLADESKTEIEKIEDWRFYVAENVGKIE